MVTGIPRWSVESVAAVPGLGARHHRFVELSWVPSLQFFCCSLGIPLTHVTALAEPGYSHHGSLSSGVALKPAIYVSPGTLIPFSYGNHSEALQQHLDFWGSEVIDVMCDFFLSPRDDRTLRHKCHKSY